MSQLDQWHQDMLLIPANARAYDKVIKAAIPTECANIFESVFSKLYDSNMKEIKYQVDSIVRPLNPIITP